MQKVHVSKGLISDLGMELEGGKIFPMYSFLEGNCVAGHCVLILESQPVSLFLIRCKLNRPPSHALSL